MNKKDNINKSTHGRYSQEKAAQADELSYLSSVAAEEFAISDKDLSEVMSRIDQAAPKSGYGGGIFISLLCGVLIGTSVFFIYFNKSKNHPGVFQLFDDEPAGPQKSLNNTVAEKDTVLAMPPAEEAKPYRQEHFASTRDGAAVPEVQEMPESLPSKTIAVNAAAMAPGEEDLVLKFVANAPVVFIHDLKITNYRLYYFKHEHRIELATGTGLSAQYSDNTDKNPGLPGEKDNAYYAHQELKDAMLEFSKAQYAACIHHLQDLLALNAADVNALFYSGMSYYYLANDAKAAECFNKVLESDNNVFHQEAAFYKAQCLLRLKQTDEALVLLKTIEAEKGFYSTRAASLLESIK